MPVYGLYDGYANVVSLTYRFMDGSSKGANITITTATFNETCGYDHPSYLQPRNRAALSYDYFLVKGTMQRFLTCYHRFGRCVAMGWHGGLLEIICAFFDNAVYLAHGPKLYRIELDGAFTEVGDYSVSGLVFSITISTLAKLD